MVRILGVSSSPRENGNTDTLLSAALDAARSLGAQTRFVALRDLNIHPCHGHADCGSRSACEHNDDFPPLSEEFLSADGVILATPVYYWAMNAQMKTFVDRNYFDYKHKRNMDARSAGIIIVAASSGFEETELALKNFLQKGAGLKRMDTLHTLRARAGGFGAAQEQPDLIEHARALGRNVFLAAKH